MSFKIYKVSNDEGKFYIGSTKSDLNTRLRKHKNAYTQYLEGKRAYYTVFDVLIGINPKIECLEELGEITSTQSKKKENEYISENPNCVNKNKAFLSEEQKAEYLQSYRNENKDKYLQYQKKYYSENIEKHKQYYITKKDIIKQTQKEYYNKNKDKILERQNNYYKNKIQKIN